METSTITTAKPTQELLTLAIAKASRLQPQTQIRLTADNNSYYLFNIAGFLYIGVDPKETSVKFFKNKSEYTMKDKDGNVQYDKLQLLIGKL
jgi:hypothetical protein